MSDKELLELAAKAAGMELYWSNSGVPEIYNEDYTHRVVWNPLTYDGDALRLAVKLSLSIDVCGDCADVTIRGNHHAVLADAMIPAEEDQMPHVRRAIVQAAAALAKGTAEG